MRVTRPGGGGEYFWEITNTDTSVRISDTDTHNIAGEGVRGNIYTTIYNMYPRSYNSMKCRLQYAREKIPTLNAGVHYA